MVVSACFLTPRHLLVLKSRAVQLLTLDFLHNVSDIPYDQAPRTIMGHTLHSHGQRRPHRMQQKLLDYSVNLRGAMFSRPQITDQQHDTSSIRITFLASDVLRGLFHYGVDIRIAFRTDDGSQANFLKRDGTAATPLDMSAKLLAVHHTARIVHPRDIVAAANALPRSGLTHENWRGYIAACALGDQSKRGVWVERKQNSMGRTIYAISPSDYADDEEAGCGCGEQQEHPIGDIRGTRLFEVTNSYDLGGTWRRLHLVCSADRLARRHYQLCHIGGDRTNRRWYTAG